MQEVTHYTVCELMGLGGLSREEQEACQDAVQGCISEELLLWELRSGMSAGQLEGLFIALAAQPADQPLSCQVLFDHIPGFEQRLMARVEELMALLVRERIKQLLTRYPQHQLVQQVLWRMRALIQERQWQAVVNGFDFLVAKGCILQRAEDFQPCFDRALEALRRELRACPTPVVQ